MGLSETLHAARESGVQALDEPSGKEILRSVGIAVPRSVVVKAGEDTVSAISKLRPPLVLKVVASGVLHKSDVGGVRMNIGSAEEGAEAVGELQAAMKARGIQPQAWLFEEMVPRGVEVVIGGTIDPEFGPLVMVGLGGIFVEVLNDVAFRICPISERDGREMLQELKGYALLKGVRGGTRVNIEALVQALLGVGGESGILVQAAEEIAEIDINPLIVSKDAAIAVDARFIMRQRR